jgi:hypothetical protein
MLDEFKKFAMRGNVVDLAVGVMRSEGVPIPRKSMARARAYVARKNPTS